MKNLKIYILLIMMSILIIPNVVKANLSYEVADSLICENNELFDQGIINSTICTVGFRIKDNAYSANNHFKFTLTLDNIVIVGDSAINEGWIPTKATSSVVDSKNVYVYEFDSVQKELPVNLYKIFTISIKRVIPNQNCHKTIKVEASNVSHNCQIVPLGDKTYYFNKNGESVTKKEYAIDCNPPKCDKICDEDGSNCVYFDKNASKVADEGAMNASCNPPEEKYYCRKVGDKYYDNEGNDVTELEYYQDCKVKRCEPFNGHYFGPTGDEVSEIEYKKQCLPHSCEILDNTYYGKNGGEVDKLTYTKECEDHYCEILSDNTYFDSKGDISSKTEYEESCFCGIDDLGKHHGNNGEIIDEDEYDKICVPHTCEILKDGTYFNKSGEIVEKEEYEKDCFACKIVGNKYYDNDGKEIDKITYEQQCKIHSCEKVGDKYYDKNGRDVTKEEYEETCPIGNPQTGMGLSILGLISILGFGIYTYKNIEKYDKFM